VTTLTLEGLSPSLFDDVGGEPTLDELLAGVWEGLTAQRVVQCPMCAADMSPYYGAHSRPLGGRCRNCGTELS
jgi:hypothetical protein